MNAIQQKRFVRQLIDAVESNIVAAIDAGKTPDEWDELEYRESESIINTIEEIVHNVYTDFDNWVIYN